MEDGVTALRRNPKARRPRRWLTAASGNRLNRLRSAIVGNANTLRNLDRNHPRRRISLPTVRWLAYIERDPGGQS